VVGRSGLHSALLLTLLVVELAATASDKQPIDVADLSRFATIGNPWSLEWDDEMSSLPVAIYSGDRKYVAVVVRGGNPDRGTNDGRLLVYRVSKLLDGAAPEVLAEFASATNYQPIAQVRWLADNETLMFAGTDKAGPSQIYSVDMRTRSVRQRTQHTAQLVWYDAVPSGERVLMLSEVQKQPIADTPLCKLRGCRVTADAMRDAEDGVLAGSTSISLYDSTTDVTKILSRTESAHVSIKRCANSLEGGVSPDGRFALRRCELHAPLPQWTEYHDPDLQRCLEQQKVCGELLVLIDLQGDRSVVLSSAPVRWDQPSPLWIDGGRRLIFPRTLESLDNVDAQERARRARSSSVVMFDVVTLKSTVIASLDDSARDITDASWNEETQTLTLDFARQRGVPAGQLRYQRAGKEWLPRKGRGKRDSGSAGTNVIVEQSLNDPPVLVAVDTRTGARRRLLDPNPWLTQRDLGKVEAISWKTKDGFTWHGGLYFPADFKPNIRYPLVVQTHGFAPNQFSLDGRARNFAGRALAAHGIVVLQVGETYGDRGELAGSAREWSTQRAGYEGAIDYLDQRDVIDRTRVGMQGWSSTGPHVGYMLTHSSYPLLAAAFTDSGDFGWWWYLSVGALPEVESLFGASPFGPGLKAWHEQSPTFNMQRVNTPMLMWEGQGLGVSGLWDWYAGLRRLNKPVEYWVLPDATHDVYQVGQRMHTNQLLVDWFRFWLKGEEDAALAKEEQYERWRQFREQQTARAQTSSAK
jgi:fermentation-respiration switch protein FrsA (DUF1100 family)